MDNDTVACRGVTVGDDLSLSGGSQNVYTVEKDVFKATTKIFLEKMISVSVEVVLGTQLIMDIVRHVIA